MMSATIWAVLGPLLGCFGYFIGVILFHAINDYFQYRRDQYREHIRSRFDGWESR